MNDTTLEHLTIDLTTKARLILPEPIATGPNGDPLYMGGIAKTAEVIDPYYDDSTYRTPTPPAPKVAVVMVNDPILQVGPNYDVRASLEASPSTPLHPIFDTEIALERTPQEIIIDRVVKEVHTAELDNLQTDPHRPRRLYELNPLIEQAIFEATEHAINNEGELPFELCDIIEQLEMDRTDKIINCILYYKDLTTQRKLITEERKKLKAREDTLAGKSTSMLTYIRTNMRDHETIEDPRFKISWRNSTKCVITDESLLPEGTYTLIKKPLIDDYIKPMLKDDTSTVPGAELQTHLNMSIK